MSSLPLNSVQALRHALALGPWVLVQVHQTRGSVPREAGAWMAVSATGAIDTIGGGRLEHDALAHARAILGGDAQEGVVRYALGPSLGQCCGGEVHLRFQRLSVDAAEVDWAALQGTTTPVALFGGGHVGRALVRVLASLPMRVTWVDSREAIFPPDLQALAQCEYSDPVQSAVAALEPGSRVLIMSFSHAEDLDIVAACLQRMRSRKDLPFVGLIGSKTKWASFRQRLEARGFGAEELARITCPIGVPGIHDKRPEVIAVAVAAQLLQVDALQADAAGLH